MLITNRFLLLLFLLFQGPLKKCASSGNGSRVLVGKGSNYKNMFLNIGFPLISKIRRHNCQLMYIKFKLAEYKIIMGHSLKLIIFPGNKIIAICHHNVDNNKNKSVQVNKKK